MWKKRKEKEGRDKQTKEIRAIKEIIPIDKVFDISLIDVYKSICKITYEIEKNKVENGSGFLIKLPKDGEEIYCLMTNHHVITKEMIDSKKTFKVEYEFRKKSISIKLNLKYFIELKDMLLIKKIISKITIIFVKIDIMKVKKIGILLGIKVQKIKKIIKKV